MDMVLYTAGAVGGIASGVISNVQNARAAGEEAKAAKDRANIEESAYRYDARRQLARGEAMVGASGIDPSSGSAMDIMMEQAYNFELNSRRIRYGGSVAKASRLSERNMYNWRNFGTVFGGATEAGGVLSSWMKK